jgi:hypothetical protein
MTQKYSAKEYIKQDLRLILKRIKTSADRILSLEKKSVMYLQKIFCQN